MFLLFSIRTTSYDTREHERGDGRIGRMAAHDATVEEDHRSFQHVECIKRRVSEHNRLVPDETLRCNRSGTPCVLERRRL